MTGEQAFHLYFPRKILILYFMLLLKYLILRLETMPSNYFVNLLFPLLNIILSYLINLRQVWSRDFVCKGPFDKTMANKIAIQYKTPRRT